MGFAFQHLVLSGTVFSSPETWIPESSDGLMAQSVVHFVLFLTPMKGQPLDRWSSERKLSGRA
jgi:hypothetical protein